MFRPLLTATLLCAVSLTSLAEPDARIIVQRLLDRNDGKSEISKQRLTTCRYAIKNNKLVCADNPRVKTMESVRKDYGRHEKDKKTISILLEPPGERGIGFLQYDYEDTARDSDQWMYFSALGKVKRIVSGSEDEPKTGSFFGSEFSYEDLEQKHIDDYRYKLLKSDIYLKRDCWVIESTPTPGHTKKSNYSKSFSWIDKERNLILKAIFVDRRGQKAKRLSVRRVKQVDGVWVPMATHINNLQTKRMSTLVLEKVAFNVGVEDEFLTQRTLIDGAFRESRLEKYRGFIPQ